MRYRFGELELDPDAYVLRREGIQVTLQPKMFELLRFLIERRERVVTKEELLDALWPGEHVNDSAVAWTVSHVRTALGQERGERMPIETIHGRGYRFKAGVELIESVSSDVIDATRTTRAINDAARRPSTLPAAGSELIARSHLSDRPFVGRGDVMVRLQALLADAQAGRGNVALLCGEAGIGKTRCAEELIESATRARLSGWLGRAVEDTGAPVFWPWIQIVRKVAVDRPALREASEKILEELSAFEGIPEPSDASETAEGADSNGNVNRRERSATTGRFLIMDAVTRLLLRATETETAVVLLDDLQWADSGTLDLLGFLAAELGSSRLLVIATHRGIQAGDPRMARILRRAERFDLAHLTPDEVGEYVAALTDLKVTPQPIALALHRATSGNPLFMQEVVRALVTEQGGTFSTLEALDIAPPEIAHDVLRVRLDRLAPATHTLLEAASTLGETFDLSLLQTISGLQTSELIEQLQNAVQSGVVVHETPQRARFAHALVRRVLYDAMNAAERMQMHRRAAVALEALPPIERRNGQIAHHFYRSLPLGEHGRVARAAQRAAGEAKALFALDEAARFYGWALEAQALDPDVTPRARAELLLAAGAAQRHSGRDADARQTLSRMFELSREHGYADLLVRGARSLRPTFAMAMVPDPMVRAALEDVLQIKPEPPREAHALALSQLAFVPPYAHDLTRSKQMSGQALAIARELGTPNIVLEALRSRLYSLSGPDDIDSLLATTEEMLAFETEHASGYSVEAYSARIGALTYRGDIAGVDQTLAVLSQVAHNLRLPEMLWYCDRLLLQRKLLDGDYAAVEAEMPVLRRRSKRVGLSYGPFFVDVIERRMARERQGIAASVLNQNLVPARDLKNLEPGVRARITRAVAELGQLDLARESLDSFAAHGFASLPKEIAYLGTLASLGVTAVILKDAPRAEQLYAQLEPYAGFNTPDGLLLYEGSASRFLAQLAICLGRTERVEQHFEDALAMNQRMGQKPMLAITQYQYARWLKVQSAHGAATRSRELASEALRLGESLGLFTLIERARALAG